MRITWSSHFSCIPGPPESESLQMGQESEFKLELQVICTHTA